MTTKAKPLTRLVADAIESSGLPFELRHVIRVYADKANRKTGKGWTGQANMAAALGCSRRTLLRYLTEIRQLPGDPWITWCRQPRRDGRGRGSDIYTVHVGSVFNAPTVAPRSTDSKRQQWRLEDSKSEAFKVTNGAVQSDKPGSFKVTPLAQDPVSDPVRGIQVDLLSGLDSPTCSNAAAPKRQEPKPKSSSMARSKLTPERTAEQQSAHKAVTGHYFAEFERLRGRPPIGYGAKEGKAVHDLLGKLGHDVDEAKRIITNGLQSWDKATIMSIAANPSACVSAADSAGPGVRAGDLLPRQMQRARELRAAEQREQLALPGKVLS